MKMGNRRAIQRPPSHFFLDAPVPAFLLRDGDPLTAAFFFPDPVVFFFFPLPPLLPPPPPPSSAALPSPAGGTFAGGGGCSGVFSGEGSPPLPPPPAAGVVGWAASASSLAVSNCEMPSWSSWATSRRAKSRSCLTLAETATWCRRNSSYSTIPLPEASIRSTSSAAASLTITAQIFSEEAEIARPSSAAFSATPASAFLRIWDISMALMLPEPSVSSASKSALMARPGRTQPVVGSKSVLKVIHSSRSICPEPSRSIWATAARTALSKGSGVSTPSAIHISAFSSCSSSARDPSSSITPKATQGSTAARYCSRPTRACPQTEASSSRRLRTSPSVAGVPGSADSIAAVRSSATRPSASGSSAAAASNSCIACASPSSTFFFIITISRASVNLPTMASSSACSLTHCLSSPNVMLSMLESLPESWKRRAT
mmetsp:Transcript_24619/g.39011  ORF Transcript_24619/g.39011 Transcript_24619/m.39011 type:complete len:430 (+) Transcript_24619:397-1686(+)